MPGRGRIRWLIKGAAAGQEPVLEVLDKGRIKRGQEVTWVLPGDGIELTDGTSPTSMACLFAVSVSEVRHLGETTVANLRLLEWPTATIAMTVSGAEQRRLVPGAPTTVALDASKVHVMPKHARS